MCSAINNSHGHLKFTYYLDDQMLSGNPKLQNMFRSEISKTRARTIITTDRFYRLLGLCSLVLWCVYV